MSIDSKQIAETVSTMILKGYDGPIFADISHPLVQYQTQWMKHNSLVTSSTTAYSQPNCIRIPGLRSTNAMTNQYGTAIVDGFTDVMWIKDTETEDTYHVVTETEMVVAMGSVFKRTWQRNAFSLSNTSSDEKLMLRRKYLDNRQFSKASVTSIDDAFEKMVTWSTNHRRTAPLFLVDATHLNLDSSVDGIACGMRIFSASDPFFFSLNKNQIEKIDSELSSRKFDGLSDRKVAQKLNRTFVQRVINEALHAYDIANRYVSKYRYQYSKDNGRVRSEDILMSTTSFDSVTLTSKLSLYSFEPFLRNSLNEIDLDQVLTRMDLLINFIYTGTKVISLDDIKSEDTSNLHPLFIRED